MGLGWCGLVVQSKRIEYVVLDIDRDNDELKATVIADDYIKVPEIDTSESYRQVFDRVNNLINRYSEYKFALRASRPMGGISANKDQLRSAEIRGVVILALAMKNASTQLIDQSAMSQNYEGGKFKDMKEDDDYRKNLLDRSIPKTRRDIAGLAIYASRIGK